MNRAQFLGRIFAFSFFFAFGASGAAPLTEKQKIERLIAKVEALDAKFIRNGSDYDAKTAAKFLRGKWDNEEEKIKTAGDFITHAGSVSSTSGKPYLIRFKDGTQKKCGDFLTEELAKLNGTAKPQ